MAAKKRKRAKKKDKPPATAEDQTIPTDTTTATQDTPTLLGESMLNRLRSRLDPLYNASPPPPPPPSSESASLPTVRPPPLKHPKRGPPLPSLSTEDRGSEQASVQEDASVREGDLTESGASQKGSRRRTKQRKNDTQRASPGQSSDLQDGATASEDVGEQQEKLKSTSRDALIAGGSERKKRRRRERERSRRTSGSGVGEDTPDTGEEGTGDVTGSRGLDSNIDDSAHHPASEGILYRLYMIVQAHA